MANNVMGRCGGSRNLNKGAFEKALGLVEERQSEKPKVPKLKQTAQPVNGKLTNGG